MRTAIIINIMLWMLIAFAIDQCQAGELYFSHGVYTRHVTPNESLNENNDLFALKYNGLMVLTASNSHNVRTWMVADNVLKHWSDLFTFKKKDLFARANLYLGLIHGYEGYVATYQGIVPAAIPSVEVGYRDVSLEIDYLPSVDGGVFIGIFNFRIF